VSAVSACLTLATLAGFKSVIIPVSLIALVVYISFTLGDMCASCARLDQISRPA
jgi:hypothetical protein